MNKTIYSLLFLLLIPLTSCGYRHLEPSYWKLVDSITKNYVKETAAPKRLDLYGYGGGRMYDIEEVILRFFCCDHLTVEGARVLYVEMMEEYLKQINCNEEVRPYLHNYPFNIDNIKLTISFLDAQGHTLGDGHVALVFISRNHTIDYAAYNTDTEEFYSLHEEPYEEALKIYNASKKEKECP